MAKVGDIRSFDYQSDIYRGQYRLVRDIGDGVWLAEHLEPTDEMIDAIMNDEAMARYRDPESEVLDRIDQAGTRFRVRLVSASTFASYF